MLFCLASPVAARADFWRYYLGAGDPAGDPSGDPDNPVPGPMAPGQKAGRVGGNDGAYRRNLPGRSDSWLMRRYLTMLRSEEHTSELQSLRHLVCRLLLEKN